MLLVSLPITTKGYTVDLDLLLKFAVVSIYVQCLDGMSSDMMYHGDMTNWEVQHDFNTCEHMLLLDNSVSYTSMYEYVWNIKWHLLAGCDSYCTN